MATRIPLPFRPSFGSESGRSGKSKSRLFSAIEDALSDYERHNTRSRLLSLTDASAAWKRSKGARGAWTSSVRAAAVKKLDGWLIRESEAIGVFPTSRNLWGAAHNCYAYSMLCTNPRGLGQNSRPGRYAGHAANRQEEFIQGVIADAARDRKTVVHLPNPATRVPALVGGGCYLVAMVANQFGYHFMRRRESTGLWTHKNGAISAVETYFYDASLEKPVAITDAVVSKLLRQPQLIECSMSFHCFLQVPKTGVQVAG